MPAGINGSDGPYRQFARRSTDDPFAKGGIGPVSRQGFSGRHARFSEKILRIARKSACGIERKPAIPENQTSQVHPRFHDLPLSRAFRPLPPALEHVEIDAGIETATARRPFSPGRMP
ncbi:hypothetical protein AB3G45_21985 [Shinella sp. S4-D37]|uniref:hypothetical protein n=1 Tax=Shinella sp. S4-D37 TaxID=3161999 RepID=UPI003467EBA1